MILHVQAHDQAQNDSCPAVPSSFREIPIILQVEKEVDTSCLGARESVSNLVVVRSELRADCKELSGFRIKSLTPSKMVSNPF